MHPALVSFLALLHTHLYTHMYTQIHTSTQGPEDILTPVACRSTRIHVKASFSPLFLKTGGVGVRSKAENTWHLSPQGAAREEGRLRLGEGGGVLKHLVSVWQQQGNCCYWSAWQSIYCSAGVLTPGKITSFYNLDLIFFISPSFLAVMNTFYSPSSFYRHWDMTLSASFMSEAAGHHKQSNQITINFCFKTSLCDTFLLQVVKFISDVLTTCELSFFWWKKTTSKQKFL